jgi:hypothetical protein
MRLLLVFVVAAVLASAAPARAQVSPERAARALSGYENPITFEKVRALGPGWEKAMAALLRDPATRPMLRPRAIAALGFSKEKDAAALLREILAAKGAAAEGLAVLETREAVKSLAAVDGAGALPELRRHLDHAVLDVRTAAARCLGEVGGAPAREALAARLAREGDEAVRGEIRSALAKLGGR